MAAIRQAAVAGRFYSADPEKLREDVEGYLSAGNSFLSSPRISPETSSAVHSPVRALGCIAPHAGYMYSGHVAGAIFSRIEIPQRCVVLCPNHTGMGRPLAIMSEGAWQTPLGDIPIDSQLAAQLKQRCSLLEEDEAAHRAEHSAEVELPFLLARQPGLTFVPIAVGTGQLEALEQLGLAIANVIAAQPDPVLIVASSDMNHYENDAVTRIKDQLAIEHILRLDPQGLHEVVRQQNISMCGYGPAVTMLTAARELGAKSAELVKYATSGDISGDRNMVVGYAGIVVA